MGARSKYKALKNNAENQNAEEQDKLEDILVLYRKHEIDPDAPLEKKTKDKKLLARLYEIERQLIMRAIEKG